MSRLVFIALIAIVAAVGIGVGKTLLADGKPKVHATGTASIGGPFTLTDQTGKRVTDKDFAGKYMLIYFGYTFCPDVCPTTLGIIAEALDGLTPAQQDKVVPIFITVDPERDTPEVLAAYVVNFHPKLIGLTGSIDDIKAVVKAYKTFFSKTGDTGNGTYTMNHSSYTYLMGPDGAYVTVFGHNTTSQEMTKKLAEIL